MLVQIMSWEATELNLILSVESLRLKKKKKIYKDRITTLQTIYFYNPGQNHITTSLTVIIEKGHGNGGKNDAVLCDSLVSQMYSASVLHARKVSKDSRCSSVCKEFLTKLWARLVLFMLFITLWKSDIFASQMMIRGLGNVSLGQI